MLHELGLRAAAAMTAHAPMGNVKDPGIKMPQQVQDKIDLLLAMLKGGALLACVAGVFLVAGKAALAHRRGELHDVTGQLGAVLAGCVLLAGGVGIVNFLT